GGAVRSERWPSHAASQVADGPHHAAANGEHERPQQEPWQEARRWRGRRARHWERGRASERARQLTHAEAARGFVQMIPLVQPLFDSSASWPRRMDEHHAAALDEHVTHGAEARQLLGQAREHLRLGARWQAWPATGRTRTAG